MVGPLKCCYGADAHRRVGSGSVRWLAAWAPEEEKQVAAAGLLV